MTVAQTRVAAGAPPRARAQAPEQAPEQAPPRAPRRPVPLILVNAAFCKRCGICIYFCPTRVFDVREDGLPLVARGGDCIWCGLCEVRCPDFAVTLKGEGGAGGGSGPGGSGRNPSGPGASGRDGSGPGGDGEAGRRDA